MGTVMIRCPRTGQAVSTEIEMEASDFERLPYVQVELDCLHCGERHTWTRREAWLADSALGAPIEMKIDEPAVE